MLIQEKDTKTTQSSSPINQACEEIRISKLIHLVNLSVEIDNVNG